MEPLLDEAAATLVGQALRANTTLTSFSFSVDSLFDDSGTWCSCAATAALLGALTAHPSVRCLKLEDFNNADAAHTTLAGGLLGALVAANAPALTELDLWNVHGDALRGLALALPRNTHLRTLRCSTGQYPMSEAFARDVVLPAVRANVGLRSLSVSCGYGTALNEAMALVAARTAVVEAAAAR